MSTRAEDITKLLNDIVEPIRKLNVFLVQDRVSYELIRGDQQSEFAKKAKLIEENDLLRQDNERIRLEGSNIIGLAKESATKIIADANAKRAEMVRLLEEVKEFCKGADRKHWNDIKEKVLA